MFIQYQAGGYLNLNSVYAVAFFKQILKEFFRKLLQPAKGGWDWKEHSAVLLTGSSNLNPLSLCCIQNI